ncbi:MAG: N-acetylmuramoyl-L-alanine amidase, partial [Actinomycetota bacterium]|nr:N-acetylmuramoyl-L-alanine amidase [Actinomycetota bacterium]
MSARRFVVVAALSALVGGLTISVPPAVAGTAGRQVATAGQEQAAFSSAAHRSGVPEPLLLAVSYELSRWETHAGRASAAGGYGPMHLLDPNRALARGEAGGPAPAGRT